MALNHYIIISQEHSYCSSFIIYCYFLLCFSFPYLILILKSVYFLLSMFYCAVLLMWFLILCQKKTNQTESISVAIFIILMLSLINLTEFMILTHSTKVRFQVLMAESSPHDGGTKHLWNTSINFYQTTKCNILEDRHLQIQWKSSLCFNYNSRL